MLVREKSFQLRGHNAKASCWWNKGNFLRVLKMVAETMNKKRGIDLMDLFRI